uniref:Uncharacterized protein n=1 Tax=Glossina austeni TaxID=7395 RepID=A0A1A9V152_GLOAU
MAEVHGHNKFKSVPSTTSYAKTNIKLGTARSAFVLISKVWQPLLNFAKFSSKAFRKRIPKKQVTNKTTRNEVRPGSNSNTMGDGNDIDEREASELMKKVTNEALTMSLSQTSSVSTNASPDSNESKDLIALPPKKSIFIFRFTSDTTQNNKANSDPPPMKLNHIMSADDSEIANLRVGIFLLVFHNNVTNANLNSKSKLIMKIQTIIYLTLIPLTGTCYGFIVICAVAYN